MQERRPLRLLADRRMPRGVGVVAIGTIRRSLPQPRRVASGLAWGVQGTERSPTLRSAKTQIS
jgi:hypothetical protein